jgi:hypothetical protein
MTSGLQRIEWWRAALSLEIEVREGSGLDYLRLWGN